MSRILFKSQEGYVPDELDSYLEELGMGYYLDDKLVEAESVIASILSSAPQLPDSDDSFNFYNRLKNIDNEARCLISKGEVDVDDIKMDIDTIRFCIESLGPSLNLTKPELDKPESIIFNEMLNRTLALGKKMERFNLAYNLEEVIHKAVLRESASINQGKTGSLNLKYQYKEDAKAIICQTLQAYPNISRSSLAEKLLQHLAKKGVNAPSKSSLVKWIAEVDDRAKGYNTQSSFKYNLVLKPVDIKPSR